MSSEMFHVCKLKCSSAQQAIDLQTVMLAKSGWGSSTGVLGVGEFAKSWNGTWEVCVVLPGREYQPVKRLQRKTAGMAAQMAE